MNGKVSTGIDGLDEMLGGGYPEGHNVVVMGSFGTGKTSHGLQFIWKGLQEGDSCIFISLEEDAETLRSAGFAWSLPDVVVEVRHLGFTDAGRFRQPVVERYREDLTAADIGAGADHRDGTGPGDGEPVLVGVGGRTVRISHLDKVLYPATGTTKARVIEYYTRVAPYLLELAADRPITRRRWPDGVAAPSFFEKNSRHLSTLASILPTTMRGSWLGGPPTRMILPPLWYTSEYSSRRVCLSLCLSWHTTIWSRRRACRMISVSLGPVAPTPGDANCTRKPTASRRGLTSARTSASSSRRSSFGNGAVEELFVLSDGPVPPTGTLIGKAQQVVELNRPGSAHNSRRIVSSKRPLQLAHRVTQPAGLQKGPAQNVALNEM